MRLLHRNRNKTNHYMFRKYKRKANPFKKKSLVFRESGCWYCIPGNIKKQIMLERLELEIYGNEW